VLCLLLLNSNELTDDCINVKHFVVGSAIFLVHKWQRMYFARRTAVTGLAKTAYQCMPSSLVSAGLALSAQQTLSTLSHLNASQDLPQMVDVTHKNMTV